MEKFYGKGSEIIGESMVRLGVEKVFGVPHQPVSELYEYMARKATFLPALSVKEAAYAALGLELGGMRSFVVTSGANLFDVMEAMSYAAALEVPFTVIHVGTNTPGFGNPYPSQGDLEVLTAGDFPPLVFTPGTPAELNPILIAMRRLSETHGVPAVLYLDSALFNITAEVELQDRMDAAGGRARVPVQEGRRLFTSVRLDVGEMETFVLSLREKWKKLETEALVRADTVKGAKSAVVAYGAASLAAGKAVERLRAGGVKMSFLSPLTLFPFPHVAEVLAGATTVVCVEMSGGQLARRLACLLPGINIVPLTAQGGALLDEEHLATEIGRALS